MDVVTPAAFRGTVLDKDSFLVELYMKPTKN